MGKAPREKDHGNWAASRFSPPSGAAWRRKWQPTLVFLPGESHGRRSLVGYSPRGRKESDMTEQLHFSCESLPRKRDLRIASQRGAELIRLQKKHRGQKRHSKQRSSFMQHHRGTKQTEWENEATSSPSLGLHFRVCIVEWKVRDEQGKLQWDNIVRTQYYTLF